MSWELTRFVLNLRNLTPTEKAVAHSLAYHAPKNGSAYPSMETIASQSGLGNRTAAQKVVRRLEAKSIISATSSKKGGRKNPTRYQFNLGNSIPTDALCSVGNSIPGDSTSGETASLETGNSIPTDARDSSKTVVVADSSKSTTTAVSQNQMEGELTEVWDYYLNKFQKDEEIISPSARRVGIAILAGLREKYPTIPSELCVDAMTSAIDRARSIVKAQPKKQYFSGWFGIFGNFETFHSLWEEA